MKTDWGLGRQEEHTVTYVGNIISQLTRTLFIVRGDSISKSDIDFFRLFCFLNITQIYDSIGDYVSFQDDIAKESPPVLFCNIGDNL